MSRGRVRRCARSAGLSEPREGTKTDADAEENQLVEQHEPKVSQNPRKSTYHGEDEASSYSASHINFQGKGTQVNGHYTQHGDINLNIVLPRVRQFRVVRRFSTSRRRHKRKRRQTRPSRIALPCLVYFTCKCVSNLTPLRPPVSSHHFYMRPMAYQAPVDLTFVFGTVAVSALVMPSPCVC